MSQPHASIPILIANVVRTAKGEALGWAIELAQALNQTDPCPRCEGRGWHEKHRNCTHFGEDRWVRGCAEHVVCKACGGSSRVMKATPSTPYPGECRKE